MKLYGVALGKAYVSLEGNENPNGVLFELQSKTKKITDIIVVKDEADAIRQMGDAVKNA